MSTHPPMQQTTVSPAHVVTPRRRGNEILLTITPAVEAAGLRDAQSLEFDDEGPLVVAKGLAERVDGRSSRHATVLRRGEDGQRLISIPKQDYDRLGLSLDGDELPRILVYAGDQTLAFEQAGGVTRTVTRPGGE